MNAVGTEWVTPGNKVGTEWVTPGLPRMILFMRAAKSLTKLHECAGSSESWLLADAISTKI